MKKTIGTKLWLGFLGFLILGLTAYVVIQYFVVGASKSDGFVGGKVELQGIEWQPWITFLYLHIIFGTIALLSGPFQFSSKLRRKNKQVHKTLGKVYIGSIFLSFVFGLYLAFYASGGIAGIIGFSSLELVWLLTTLIGLLKIRKKDITRHKEWMIRSYAVTLTFVTFRILSVPAVIIEGSPGVLFGLTVILSWAINLSIAEWNIARGRKKMGRGDRSLVPYL
jgi:uncharacterized membrane protein